MWPCRWLPAFHTEHGGNTFLKNVVNHLQDHMASQPRKPWSTSSAPWGPHFRLLIQNLFLKADSEPDILSGSTSLSERHHSSRNVHKFICSCYWILYHDTVCQWTVPKSFTSLIWINLLSPSLAPCYFLLYTKVQNCSKGCLFHLLKIKKQNVVLVLKIILEEDFKNLLLSLQTCIGLERS